ncbi:hypothetical protein GGR58DRAFT_43324 [Xylaria digitata]|nr:hypothetical protein GGR58DRAFT_43324 [Xylaria digitata]
MLRKKLKDAKRRAEAERVLYKVLGGIRICKFGALPPSVSAGAVNSLLRKGTIRTHATERKLSFRAAVPVPCTRGIHEIHEIHETKGWLAASSHRVITLGNAPLSEGSNPSRHNEPHGIPSRDSRAQPTARRQREKNKNKIKCGRPWCAIIKQAMLVFTRIFLLIHYLML